MKKTFKTMSYFIAIFLVGVSISYAQHYVSKYIHSVDDGEIRYGGSTQYSNYFNYGKDTWNNLGDVDILPDTWWTWEDLTISDVNEVNNVLPAWWANPWTGNDKLQFNKPKMNLCDLDSKKNVSIHELGHALGLRHTPSEDDIMYEYVSYSDGNTSLSDHDKDDYDYLWGDNGVGID